MKAVVFTLGCKVNQYESQALINKLSEAGFLVTAELGYANLYIINTCSVTAEADKKSRQAVTRALKFNPDAGVIVLGCSSQNDIRPYLNKSNVIAASGTGGKIKALESGLNALKNRQPALDLLSELPSKYEDDLTPELNKTRALIKIQDGCNRFCSYCRVPYLRGRSRSRPVLSIIAEAERLAKTTKEIVLTGVDISSYGLDIETDLITLILAFKGKERKRLGSLECSVIDEKLLTAMKESNFCDHFHVSLQSGCDSVLKRMNRRYFTKDYLSKVNLIREFFPYAGITTDIITGFSLETDEEHDITKEFIKKTGFSDIHIFPYSRRKGTQAYSLPDIKAEIKAQRAKELNEIKQETRIDFFKKNLGRITEVYNEQNSGGYNFGFTSNYIKVYNKGQLLDLSRVKLVSLFKDSMLGENI